MCKLSSISCIEREMSALCNLHCNVITAVLIKIPISNVGSYIHFYDILFNNFKIVIILFSIIASNNECKFKHYYNRAILDIFQTILVTYLT